MRVLKGEVFTGATVQDIVIRARDGRDIQLNVSGAPVRDQDGQIRGAVMVMRDVTEQRRMVIERDRLLRQREQLRAKEMALRIANQQEAHAKELALRETKERMDEFLSIASHELRTPMTTIKGNIQLAKLRLTHSVRNLSAGGDDLQNNLEEIQMMLDRAERQVNVQNRTGARVAHLPGDH